MKRFRLFWLDKTMEDIEGNDIADAFRRAGYGGGAISALDYYKEVEANGQNTDQRRAG